MAAHAKVRQAVVFYAQGVCIECEEVVMTVKSSLLPFLNFLYCDIDDMKLFAVVSSFG